ncbi:MAG TPA: hypothetical protein ENI08_00870 [Candidatus Dependentiae bacterium]|nr:hypothetical protein [Candidatus Dependentiae bacterium]
MIHSSEELTKLQAKLDKNEKNVGPLSSRLLATISPPEPDAQSSIKTNPPLPSDDQKTLISKQPPIKKRKLDISVNTRFIIICHHCSPKKTFFAYRKPSLTYHFKEHLRIIHPNIAEKETKDYIDKYLKEPENLSKFLVKCPVFGCEHIARSYQTTNLKDNILYHISSRHPDNKDNHSKKSIAAAIESYQVKNSQNPLF